MSTLEQTPINSNRADTWDNVRPLQQYEFDKFKKLLFEISGIHLSEAKIPLVSGRLLKQVRQHGLTTYEQYFDIIANDQIPGERQVMLNLLTTNETYFFRESLHFDFLKSTILPQYSYTGTPFRVWSAASSSGEEAYTIAMTLASELQMRPWEIVGSDLNMDVLRRASMGVYPAEESAKLPPGYLGKFCLRGEGSQAGNFRIRSKLRERVNFYQVNLNQTLPNLGMFDVIFLRNVMIYFQDETKAQVVARLIERLKPGGYFIIGRSETIARLTSAVELLQPSIYRKV